MKERLEELMKLERLTSVKLAEILDVQPSNISHIMSGRNNPSYDFIVKFIDRFPHVNAEWIISGKGDIYKSKSQDKSSVVTNVNKAEFTVVTTGDVPHDTVDNSINTHSANDLYSDTFVTHNLIDEVLSTSEKDTLPLNNMVDSGKGDSQSKKPEHSKVEKTVSRIILIYSDNSFEVLKN